MSKVCFLCATPFHVLVASAIVCSEKLDADIYIFDDFSECDSLIERISNTKLFNNVYKINNSIRKLEKSNLFNRVRMYIKVLSMYIFIDHYGMKILRGNVYYSSLFIFHRDNSYVKTICMFLKKHNSGISICYYEDGIGNYCNRNIYNDKGISKLFEICHLKSVITLDDLVIYLFSPEFYYLYFGDNLPIKNVNKIINLNKLPELTSIVDNLYGNHNAESLTKLIYLDTVRQEDLNNEGINLLDDILQQISTIDSSLIIKSHPREKDRNSHFKYLSADAPIEYYCYKNDLSKHILITIFSSAVFSPKLLFDQEPYIIFLYDILFDYLKDHSIDRNMMYNQLKVLYKNGSKIIVPKTVDELNNVLLKLLCNNI